MGEQWKLLPEVPTFQMISTFYQAILRGDSYEMAYMEMYHVVPEPPESLSLVFKSEY
jgi:hypothetical protein